MQSYAKDEFGIFRQEDQSGNVLIRSNPKLRHVLIVTTDNKGDFHHPNAHEYSTSTMRYASGSKIVLYPNGALYLSETGDLGIVVNQYGLDFTGEAYNRALSKVYDAWRGGMNLAVDLAEAHQVKSMVSSVIRGTVNLARTVEQIRRSPTKSAANIWLQYVYGWRPLAQSIYGTFNEFFRVRPFRIRKTATVRQVDYLEFMFDDPVMDKYEVHSSSRALIDVYFRPPQSVIDTLSGYTSLNPLAIAWELVPYSFVVDWFYNIGGYMQNLESAYYARSAFLKGYTTITRKNMSAMRRYGVSRDSRFWYYDISGTVWNGYKKRSVLTSSPLPVFPRLKVDLGSNQILSAVSLLRQRIG